MTETNPRCAVITGVSSGIGRAIGEALIADGWRVFGSVRKAADGEAAAAALGPAFTPLVFDVTNEQAIAEAAQAVERHLNGATLGALINNAGIAVAGPLRYIPLAEIEHQFNVNIFGPIRVSRAFLPLLGADPRFAGAPGRIINMSSVAGRLASPLMSPYAMSKHALEAMSDSFRRELLIHGIDVITIGPGAVKTPIWAKADEINVEQYAKTEYFDLLKALRANMQSFGAEGLPASAVGNLVRDILNNPRPKARYAILRNKLMMWTLPTLLPSRIVDGFIAKRFGIKPRNR